MAVCIATGGILLRDAAPDWAVRFIAGAAILSAVVFVLCCLGMAYPPVFAAAGIAALAWGIRYRPSALQAKIPRLAAIAFGVFFILYFCNAMAPEISYDGSRYHLGLVGATCASTGFTASRTTCMPASRRASRCSTCSPMRSADTPRPRWYISPSCWPWTWQIYDYARRQVSELAGICAALLVFASPLAGVDASSAYEDVAVAAIAFACSSFCNGSRSTGEADCDRSAGGLRLCRQVYRVSSPFPTPSGWFSGKPQAPGSGARGRLRAVSSCRGWPRTSCWFRTRWLRSLTRTLQMIM